MEILGGGIAPVELSIRPRPWLHGAEHELRDALVLLRQVQAVLTLIGEDASQEGAFPEPDAATLVRCVGAVDFAHLDADITAAIARVGKWYARLIEAPAKHAGREALEWQGENAS